jgi:hypothetical protein
MTMAIARDDREQADRYRRQPKPDHALDETRKQQSRRDEK